MIGSPSAAGRLDEVLHLTAALTDAVLDAQITGRPVPSRQAVALAQAARLLQDQEIEWPPMLRQALHGLAATVDETRQARRTSPASEAKTASVIGGLTRFMGSFRCERGST